MEKIPTIFERGPDFKVIDKVTLGCEWALCGLGYATEKLDGTNVRLTVRSCEVVRVEKRRNPTKAQKKKGIVDGWYTDALDFSAEDKWINAAVQGTDVSQCSVLLGGWPDGEHCCEAMGPKIQGNLLGLTTHVCVPFNLEAPKLEGVAGSTLRHWSFNDLKAFLKELDSKYAPGHLAEGIVFHHQDGRRAKIKRKDFAY